MRHRVYGKHLSRDSNQRAALFKSLVGSLILHGSIETTQTKAAAIKGLVDQVINQAKHKETRRLLQSFLTQKVVVDKLVNEVAPSLKSRNSGYTSVIKLGNRLGDNAMVVRMTLLTEEVSKEGRVSKVSKEKEAVIPSEVSEVEGSVVEEQIATSSPKASSRNDVGKKAPRKVAKK